MTNVRTAIYKEAGKGRLSFIGKGMCLAYEPVIEVNNEPDKNNDLFMLQPHVTFKMGEYRLHFNKDDLKKLLEEL